MWIYINDLGQVTTSIPHGQIIRQGSSFFINIAFEKNYFNQIIKKYFEDLEQEYTGNKDYLIWTDEELIRWLTLYVAVQIKFDDTPIQMPIPKKVMFEKLKANENIGALKDKENYIVFKFKGLPNYTEEFGLKNLTIRFATTTTKLSEEEDRQWNEGIVTHSPFVNGVVQVYVEPTYGYTPQVAEITYTQVDYFLEAVNERLRPIWEELDLKLYIKDEKVRLIEEEKNTYEAFASTCRVKNSFFTEARIFLGKINGETSIGIVDQKNSVTIITSSGVIKKIAGADGDSSIKIETNLKVNNVDVLEELDKKLNLSDEKVKVIEEDYNSIHSFAGFCNQYSVEENVDKIFFGKVLGERVVAICSSNYPTLILESNGRVSVSDTDGYVPLSFGSQSKFEKDVEVKGNLTIKDSASGISSPKIITGTMEVQRGLNVLSNGATVRINPPTQDDHATTKKYVDDEIKKVKEESNLSFSSYISYIEDDEEGE